MAMKYYHGKYLLEWLCTVKNIRLKQLLISGLPKVASNTDLSLFLQGKYSNAVNKESSVNIIYCVFDYPWGVYTIFCRNMLVKDFFFYGTRFINVSVSSNRFAWLGKKWSCKESQYCCYSRCRDCGIVWTLHPLLIVGIRGVGGLASMRKLFQNCWVKRRDVCIAITHLYGMGKE